MRLIGLAFRLAIVALVVLVAQLAYAQATPPPVSGADLGDYAVLVSTGLLAAAYLLRRWTPNTGWLHTGAGHAVIVVVATIAGGVGDAIAEQGISRHAIVIAIAAGLGALMSAGNPSNQAGITPAAPRAGGQSGRASLVVLMVIAAIGFGLALAGCAGFKAPTYSTLEAVSTAADEAVVHLPEACEITQNAIVDKAASKAAAIADTAVVHNRCLSTLTVLQGVGVGIKDARDTVHAAPDGAAAVDVLAFGAALVRSWCDLKPILALLGYVAPAIKGVC